ncbi:MAG: FHA domain-containing protein [Phycisphaerae bacterium]
MVQLQCQCGKKLKLPSMHIGKPAACPNCQQRVRMVAAQRLDNVTSRSAFLIESGPQRVGELIFLLGDQTISVGKSADANLSFRSADVSRVHCYLRAGSHGWRIEDNDSTNGLFVNGRRVNGHNLLDGDSVGVSAFVLQYINLPAATRRNLDNASAEMSETPAGVI